MKINMMESCIFSYYIGPSNVEIEELQQRHQFGKYTMLTDSRTPVLHTCGESRECMIFGYAVNVHTSERARLADECISCCSSISDVIEYEKSLGGKYLILYRDREQYYLLGDATCSIPIYYHADGAFACTGNMNDLVRQYGCSKDSQLQRIRESGDISQAMPFDITPYREIKQLLPNHYLLMNTGETKRFINSAKRQNPLTVDEATELAAPMIETICEFYRKHFTIECPLTSGRDSRVVLAFLAGKGEHIHCYTIWHPEHREDSQDLVIPRQVCARNHIAYEQIHDVTVPEEVKGKFDRLLGEGNYSQRTLRIAQTIHEHYGDSAIINGDIIGQVGKCSLHRDIPSCFATPGYFRCKLHNYSRASKKQLGLWLKEIQNSGECVNTFDLFSIENRMGRWAAQENLIYNEIGQVYLNIFNSRSIIYLWTAVSRKERKKARLHIGLIEKKMPQLLDTPFETDERVIIRLSKANGMTYLLSSYAKYYMERRKFMGERDHEEVNCDS
ncbi:MAG: hypothetical protein ACI4WX_05860 [Aristaeellaceae bacterium]